MLSVVLQPWCAKAFEAGALTPAKPDYQLPPVPNFKPADKSDALQMQSDLKHPVGNDLSTLRFVLQAVQFEGKSSLGADKLRPVIAPYIGKKMGLLDLETLRLQLQQTYIDAGYRYTSVLLPSQKITTGIVHYRIDEGRLTQINIQGNERLKQDYIRARIAPDATEPINRDALQERFQSLLQDPLIERVNGVLKPGTAPGETVLDLDITRAKPYELNIGMDNYTTPSIGSYTGRLDGLVRNLTGWGDFLRVNISGSEGTKNIGGYFSLPLNSKDTRFNISYQGNASNVIDSKWKNQNVDTGFMDFNAGISHPLYKTLNRVLALEGQIAYRQTKTTVLGIPLPLGEGGEENGKARVSVLRCIQNYLQRDELQVLSLRSSMNIGVDALDATINPNGASDGRYFSWLGQLRYLYKFDQQGTQLFIRGDVQLSSGRLLPLERFALGGVNTVRGYRQNEMVRDEGYAVAVELRYPLLPDQTQEGHHLNLVPFFDLGGASTDSIAGRPSATLMSTGLGLQWSWKQLDADFYWARALSNFDSSSRGDPNLQDQGINFRFHARLL